MERNCLNKIYVHIRALHRDKSELFCRLGCAWGCCKCGCCIGCGTVFGVRCKLCGKLPWIGAVHGGAPVWYALLGRSAPTAGAYNALPTLHPGSFTFCAALGSFRESPLEGFYFQTRDICWKPRWPATYAATATSLLVASNVSGHDMEELQFSHMRWLHIAPVSSFFILFPTPVPEPRSFCFSCPSLLASKSLRFNWGTSRVLPRNPPMCNFKQKLWAIYVLKAYHTSLMAYYSGNRASHSSFLVEECFPAWNATHQNSQKCHTNIFPYWNADGFCAKVLSCQVMSSHLISYHILHIGSITYVTHAVWKCWSISWYYICKCTKIYVKIDLLYPCTSASMQCTTWSASASGLLLCFSSVPLFEFLLFLLLLLSLLFFQLLEPLLFFLPGFFLYLP